MPEDIDKDAAATRWCGNKPEDDDYVAERPDVHVTNDPNRRPSRGGRVIQSCSPERHPGGPDDPYDPDMGSTREPGGGAMKINPFPVGNPPLALRWNPWQDPDPNDPTEPGDPPPWWPRRITGSRKCWPIPPHPNEMLVMWWPFPGPIDLPPDPGTEPSPSSGGGRGAATSVVMAERHQCAGVLFVWCSVSAAVSSAALVGCLLYAAPKFSGL